MLKSSRAPCKDFEATTGRKQLVKPSKPVKFEPVVKKLETIITDMENDSLDLEASLKAYTEGVALVRQAQQYLSEAEQKIYTLSEDSNGESKQD